MQGSTAGGRLAGKRIAVTGGASGIGAAAVRAFLAEGARVAVLDRSPDLPAQVRDTFGDRAAGVVCDVTGEPAVAAAFTRVEETLGGLDVLYNCAGVQLHGRDTRAHELDLAVWEETLGVNLTGTFLSCKYGIRLLLAAGGGAVINCASPTGLTACAPGYDAYSASKGGVLALTRVLAADYGRDNIRVNSIIPGTIQTPLIEQLTTDPEWRAGAARGSLLGRLGTAEDLAGVAVFLASDAAAYATGASFAVDGGLTAG